jgi:hypothetical protein
MLAQLDRISVLGELENVWLGIIPLDTRVDCWHEHAFELQDHRGEGEAVVTIETQTSQVITTDPGEVAFYREAFMRLRESALHGPEAETLLRQVRGALLGTGPPS